MKHFCLTAIICCLFWHCKPKSTSEIHKGDTTESWAFPAFEKVDRLNPILKPSPDLQFTDPIHGKPIAWEARNVLNPTAIVKDGKVYLFYRAQDARGTSRIGLALSDDGLHFTKEPAPIFYPDKDRWQHLEWHKAKSGSEYLTDLENDYFDGCEDPRIMEMPEGGYLMTYTAYDGKTARLCTASSMDLRHWTKHGPVLKDPKYKEYWSKAGALVGERKGDKVIATKINGIYWMYFGDTDLFMATSTDLIDWKPLENEENGKLVSVLHPRPGYFDSRLVEPGPYALKTDNGIVLIYNASNAANYNDGELPKFTYAAAQALFDPIKPYRLIDRSNTYFIHPDKSYEKVGEVNEVCFVEGLVPFDNQWLLYYGTADSKIAVAIAPLD